MIILPLLPLVQLVYNLTNISFPHCRVLSYFEAVFPSTILMSVYGPFVFLRTIETVSLFSAATILWVLSICVTCVGHYAPYNAQDATHHAILQSRVNAVIIATANWAAILWVLWRHTCRLYCFSVLMGLICINLPAAYLYPPIFTSVLNLHVCFIMGSENFVQTWLPQWRQMDSNLLREQITNDRGYYITMM